MRLGLGILGLGTAAAPLLSAARFRSDISLKAVADERIHQLDLPEIDGCAQYATLEAMLEDDSVQAVHIATPTRFHLEHVCKTLAAGRHVIVEKPVTANSEEAETLLAAASKSDCCVLVGHSESFEPYVQAARGLVASGEIGVPIIVIARKFTDWMRRPRLPEEWDPRSGGGLIRRQGVHQVDVVRTLVDSTYEVRSARTRPDSGRASPGSYFAWLDGGGGADAFLAHDAVGRLTASYAGSTGAHEVHAEAGSYPDDVSVSEKYARSSALIQRALSEPTRLSLGAGDTEQVMVLGSEGDLVASQTSVEVRSSPHSKTVELHGFASGRDAVLDELTAAVLRGEPLTHDLYWGARNLRLCEDIERAALSAASSGDLNHGDPSPLPTWASQTTEIEREKAL